MKNLLILTVFLIGLHNLSAQEVIMTGKKNTQKMQEGSYYKYAEEDVEKFRGTWATEDGEFKVFISEKKKYFKDFDVYMQRLTGNYCKEVTNCNIDSQDFSLLSGSIEYEDGITARFLFKDKKKNKLGTAKLELIEGNKAKWTLTNNREGLIIGEYDRSFSVPSEAIMTKIE